MNKDQSPIHPVTLSPNGRYSLGDHGYVLGMQGVDPVWWHQWTGPGGQHSRLPGRLSAFDRYYPDGLSAWVTEQATLLKRTGVKLLTQWTETNLALAMVSDGSLWVPVLMPAPATKSWVESGCVVSEGVELVRQAARELRASIEVRGYDYRKVLAGVIDWQEVVWDSIRYGILGADAAVAMAEELFPACVLAIKEELPGIPVWSPKLAGSTTNDHADSGWRGFDDDPMGGFSHRWALLRAASAGREVLCLNCYGDRRKHRLDEQHSYTRLPIVITEFARWTLSREANPYRWADFKVMGRKKSYYPANSSRESAESITGDVIFDAEAPYILGSCLYLWSHHAWDWGFAPNQRLFGYLGHAVDPTRPDPSGSREWRDYQWMDEVRSAAEEADTLARKLRGTP